jgi:hypothetical protein
VFIEAVPRTASVLDITASRTARDTADSLASQAEANADAADLEALPRIASVLDFTASRTARDTADSLASQAEANGEAAIEADLAALVICRSANALAEREAPARPASALATPRSASCDVSRANCAAAPCVAPNACAASL